MNSATIITQTSEPDTVAGEDVPSEPDSVAHAYSELFKAYGVVSGGLRAAKMNLERKAAIEPLGAIATKFVDLAAKHPRDPGGFETGSGQCHRRAVLPTPCQSSWKDDLRAA